MRGFAEPRARSEETGSTAPGGDTAAVDDCLDMVWQLAVARGLSSDQAADVCLVTLLRLRDRRSTDGPAAGETTESMLQTAIEECRVAWQLSAWRRPRLVAVDHDPGEVRG